MKEFTTVRSYRAGRNTEDLAPIERELAFCKGVCSGNLETVKTLFAPLGDDGFGRLCNDTIKDLRYHLVVTIAILTRYCSSSGMTRDEAHTLSDAYLQRTEHCCDEKEINAVYYDMVIEFTKRMRQISTGRIYPRTMSVILDYISDHLNGKLLVQDIATYAGCSVPYISRLFKSETGVAISSYIMEKKIEAAENMLRFSDYTALEISNHLSFSSQSYFIKQFRRHTGLTPKEYKDTYFPQTSSRRSVARG